jgi:hypothetical protein
MQLHGQMVRVPVTARQKFHEAAYLYNGMFANRTNSVVFPYYLSAFVSALRSVTYYMQKQYAREPRFCEWYASDSARWCAAGRQCADLEQVWCNEAAERSCKGRWMVKGMDRGGSVGPIFRPEGIR